MVKISLSSYSPILNFKRLLSNLNDDSTNPDSVKLRGAFSIISPKGEIRIILPSSSILLSLQPLIRRDISSGSPPG